MQIDWTIIAYFVIGYFALNGFFRGWWKEAILTSVLIVLLFLVQNPTYAEMIINGVNDLTALTWEFIIGLLGTDFGISVADLMIDPTSSLTWVVILFLLLGLSALLSRMFLPHYAGAIPGKYYVVQPVGRVLGLLLGVFNGVLVLSLLREYLDGRSLPGQTPVESEITLVGRSVFGPAASSVSIQAVNLPNFTLLDSFIPWLLIGGGALIILAVLRSRVVFESSKAGRRVAFAEPYGYKKLETKKPPDPQVQRVEVVNQ